MLATTIPITRTTHSRLTPELRDTAAFGAVFSDHMLVADWANGSWSEPQIVPYGTLVLPAAPIVAHYGQGIFEGFKAFPRPNGGAVLFRPDANHARMNRSCARMAMPEVPASLFVEGTRTLVAVDRDWIPASTGSALYVRPVLFATGESLGVRPSDRYRFIVETCPSGPYFSGSVDLLAEEIYVRAFPGGTGAAKCGGNYAGSLLAAGEAQKRGFHNVLWLDGIERRYVEEAGLMNVAFVIDGVVVTPPLSGTILAGITRQRAHAASRHERRRPGTADRHRRSVRRPCRRPARFRRRHRHGRHHRTSRTTSSPRSRNHHSRTDPRLATRPRRGRAGRDSHGTEARSPRLVDGHMRSRDLMKW
jgi:branched-chain amino acid aminotransferase